MSSPVKRLPQKRYFRQRAHANPFSDHQLEYPVKPSEMNWDEYYPKEDNSGRVEFADIGCGYGGLLVSLSPLFPNIKMLGMEIRVKVTEYVRQRIEALRSQHASTGAYRNIAVIRTNAMKCMPHFFEKAQLSKLFFLFPDPHFKRKKHKARIISPTLLSDYAYYLKEEAWLYTATDVLELHEWMVKHLNDHPLFERIDEKDYVEDPVVHHILHSTEEGLKVSRNEGSKYIAIYKRVLDPIEKKNRD